MATYTLTNLLPSSSFENTGWSASSNCSIAYATSPVHSGSYSLQINSTSSSESLIVTSTTIPLIDEHIYYCGVYFYEVSAVCTSMQVYWPIAEPTWGNSYIDSTKLGQWQRLGWRIIRSAWSSGNYQFRFDFEGMAASTTAYIDDAVLIDLTACFGSGNEPSRDWCDRFIPYFESTTTVEYNTYDLITASPTSFRPGDVINCTYSGVKKFLTLPAGEYLLQCWGAQGGTYSSSYASGGLGGYSEGVLTLKKPTVVYMYSGGAGSYYTTSTYTSRGGGGFNGGGGAGYRGGTGGGGSDIRIRYDSLYARVIVAGGGGGAYAYSSTYKAAGGAGGGTSGVIGGYYSSSYTTYRGNPGTQTSGGASGSAVTSGNYDGGAGTFGVGGTTGYKYNSTSYYSSGAGGGGWYGGGAADHYNGSYSRTRYASGGGGGSGYIYTSSTASSYPSGCLLKSSYYLKDAFTSTGATRFLGTGGDYETGHSSNGHTRISILSLLGQKYIKVNSQGSLPSGYTQLEYIESHGTEYIDTGYYYNSNMRIIADVEPEAHTAHACLCSSRDGTNANTIMIFLVSGTTWAIDHGATSNNRYKFTEISNRARVLIDLNLNSASINESSYTFPIETFSATGSTIQIFRDGYGSQYPLKTKLYSFKMWDGTSLIRNFIPAMRNSDQTIGLYDLVYGTFYTDAAGGNFSGNLNSITTSDTLYLFNGETLTDTSGNNNGVTNVGVTTNTSYKKFNNSSMYFNGSSYLSLSENYITGTNDWTIDWWEYRLDTTNNRAVYHSNYAADTGYGMLIGYSSSNQIYAYATSANSSWNIFSGLLMGTLQTNTWVHRAMVRQGSTFYTFENGTLIATASSSASIAGNLTPTIGFYDYSTNYYFYGYIDNLRISKVARWTSNFEPPTLEYGNTWRLIDDIYVRTSLGWSKEV